MVIIDHTSNQVVSTYNNDGEDDLVSVETLAALNHNLFAVGGEDGIVKLFDTRSKKPVSQQWHDHDDFVSGLLLMRHKLISVGYIL